MENNHQQQHNPKRQKISSSLTYNNNNNNNHRRKTEACLKFQRGSCNYGYRCCFIHTNANLIKPPNTSSSKLCWRYLNGDTCPFGHTCHFIHFKPKMDKNNNKNNTIIAAEMPWRTKLCHSWVSFATCKYGSNCSYAHGESELQKRGSDNAESACKWVDKTCEKEVNGMRWEFKWDVDKISHVYGDWINDTPLVHVDTGNIPT